jgi:hypothetical protein
VHLARCSPRSWPTPEATCTYHAQLLHQSICLVNFTTKAQDGRPAGADNFFLPHHREALHLAGFASSEPVRSAQLYGVRPELVQQAAAWLVQQRGVQHIDLNFGCPVRKVTSKGGEACAASAHAQPQLAPDACTRSYCWHVLQQPLPSWQGLYTPVNLQPVHALMWHATSGATSSRPASCAVQHTPMCSAGTQGCAAACL